MTDTNKNPVGRPTLLDDEKRMLGKLQEHFDQGTTVYAKDFQRMRVLDMTDRGELWKAIGATFPKYQILPDTNYIAYVKNNLLASIYSVTKSAEIIPTSDKDKDLCINLNVALDCLWDTENVGYYQFQAGERAALCNLGITQVGWDENVTKGTGEDIVKGTVKFKNISPDHFMRDPYSESLQLGSWCCIYYDFHASVFRNDSRYKAKFEEWEASNKDSGAVNTPAMILNNVSSSGKKNYYTLFKWWVKNKDGGIDEIHTVNNQKVLYRKDNIKPNLFPFAQLYCNLPAGALIGTSECSKIFANNVAYNLLDSLAITAEYKNQRPPKFISDQSKLNIQAFAKHGDEADRTFVVSGNAEQAVHYHQFPATSNSLPQMKMSLEYGIQNVTGIDGRYTGRDTGSIITTGGTEEMLNRVTLIDTPKIIQYEEYCRELTKLVLLNMIEFSPKRKFYRKRPNTTKYETIEVNFPKLSAETLFNYRIEISSELPKNKQRIAAMATDLLQAQAQYRSDGDNVNWITEEEWLMFQDIPMKEYMLERMGVQRQENALEEVAQVLYNYSGLVQNGLTPDQAMMATAQQLQQTRAGTPPDLIAGANPDLQQMAGEVNAG